MPDSVVIEGDIEELIAEIKSGRAASHYEALAVNRLGLAQRLIDESRKRIWGLREVVEPLDASEE